MPVLFIAMPADSQESRAELAERITAVIAEAAQVAADKVQIFFSVADALRVTVHLVAEPVSATTDRVASALRRAQIDHMAVTAYSPAHTAKGGKLRAGRGDA